MSGSKKIGAVMVVGGGISGMQSALDLADAGLRVYIVEKSPSIGGTMTQLDKTFPTNDCSMCILAPKMSDCYGHPNIDVLTSSELIGLEGETGDFKAKVFKKARYVDIERCTGCGDCIKKCPTKGIPNEWEMGVTERKAIYIQFPQAVPMAAIIDPESCKYLTEGKCGVCAKVCTADAINYDDKDEEIELEVGSVILSLGFDLFDSRLKKEYGYGVFDNVVNSMEFERMLSACGPYEGIVRRPSDNQKPKKVAFLQCVGSRDEKVGNTYCSSVCCMYALKEAIIAGEHSEDLSSTIFFMDIRAVGKEFEDYKIKAENEYGIRLVRGTRVAMVEEVSDSKDLLVRYSIGDEILEETFDMVVLSAGLCSNKSGAELAGKLGVNLNKYGFCDTDPWNPLVTTREGIFVTGAFSAPKDIPTSVAEASGAAAKAGAVVAAARNTLTTVKEYPDEKEVSGQEPRVGAFICHCGINIGGVVDVPEVAEYARTLSNVVYAEDMLYTCSQDSLEKIKQMIKKHDLNRVVVASCTPRTHEPLFQNAIKEAGLNPFLFDMANIRDQCSWVHIHEPEKATQKAKDLVRMAVARVRLLESLQRSEFSLIKKAAVIGGGIAGMTAALEIAEQGYDVDLIERTDSLGGNMKRVTLEFGGKTGPQAVDELKLKIAKSERISVHLEAEIENVTGYIGNYTFQLSGGEIETGAIVVATGAQEYRPTEYFYGEDERVMTQLELAQLMTEKPLDAKTVTMIQCVGSRTEDNPMCSRICCSTAMKNAINIKQQSPKTDVYVFFKDIRTYGFREDLYREAGRLGVKFIRMDEGAMPDVIKDGGDLLVKAKDIILGDEVQVRSDLVILSTGIRPNEDNEALSKMLKVFLSKDGFFLEAHMKLRPVDFATPGIFLAGLAHWPKFADESIAQAAGAAARVITVISKDQLESEGTVCHVDPFKCRGCGRCEAVCKFSAAQVQEVEPGVFKCVINPSICKGCAVCAVACCNGAITARHFTNDQILAKVESMLVGGDL